MSYYSIPQDVKKTIILKAQHTKMLRELQDLILLRDVHQKKIIELEMAIDMIERRLGYVQAN